MNTAPIIKHFSNYSPLSDSEISELKSKLIEKKVKRRQFILQEGDVCKHYTFVVSGCFKMYKVDDKGQEHNLQFAIENGWIADIGSFHTDKPSELYIEALEQSIVLQISKPDLIYLYSHYPKFDRNFRVLIENAFISLQKRVLQNISSTAEERYLYFLKSYPNLFNRISNVQIASYIGVTPEFLSKIRKSIATK
ncbi:MAG TPA: Crp/Fnr family transcriptional regulator [Flavobacteriia bacterium]|jgi:CRP-like cAMP-binding protein|nr:Crp/Fnr family transcriptional regulator [Flavobacteriia bacterium]